VYSYKNGGEYYLGIINPTVSNRAKGYYYAIGITDAALPVEINGNDYADPLIWVKWVTSQAEELLDGVARPCTYTYRGLPRFANNTYTFTRSSRTYTGTTMGYNRAALPSYRANSWVYTGDAAGHLFYSVGEITRYWFDGDARSGFARVNNTSFSVASFAKYSKGWIIKNVINPPLGQWASAESASTKNQFETQYNWSVLYPSHAPDYIAREGMIYPPKLGLYGTNSADSSGSWNNTSGVNVVRDANDANAPQIPTTLQELLTELGEI
jgi:hypothetical protein